MVPKVRGFLKLPQPVSWARISVKMKDTVLARKEIKMPETEARVEADVPHYSAIVVVEDPIESSETTSPPTAGEIRPGAVSVVVVPGAFVSTDPVKLSVSAIAMQGQQLTVSAPRLSVGVTVQ